MKKKLYTAIGLMSGTSMDGIDLSIISSDGYDEFSNILDDYYEYDKNLQDQLVRLRDLVLTKKDLLQNSEKLRELERNLTLFHADAVNQSLKKYRDPIDLIGFHGQTIFHNVKEKRYQFGTYHSYGRGRDYVIYRDIFGNPFKVRLPKNDPGGEHE